jgi:hypothetical protein
MLSPTDLSELESLQTILDQINWAIAEIRDGSAQILENDFASHKVLQMSLSEYGNCYVV